MIGGPIGFLVSLSIASAIAAAILVKIAGQLFELAGIAKAMVFGGIWTAVTTMAGMRSLNSKARKLRTNNAKVMKNLKERRQ